MRNLNTSLLKYELTESISARGVYTSGEVMVVVEKVGG